MELKKDVINFYRFHLSPNYSNLVDRIIELFNQKFSNIYVRSYIFNDWGEYLTQLFNTFNSSPGPDIFQAAGGGGLKRLVSWGKVYDLTSYVKGSDRWIEFYPHVLGPFSVKGKVYALPLEQGWIFCWYNKEIFARLGLTPPTEFNELLDICKILSSHNIIPFALGMAEPWTAAFYYIYLSGRIGGYRLFEHCADRKPWYSFLDKNFTIGAEQIKQLLGVNPFPEKFHEISYEDQRALFYKEKTGMQLMGNRLLNYILKESPSFLDKVDFFHFPEVEGGAEDQSVIQGGSVAAFAINNDTKFIKETIALLKFLTGDEARSLLIEMTEDLPAGPDGYDSSCKHLIWQRLMQEMSSAKEIQLHHFKYLDPGATRVYFGTIKSLFLDRIKPEELGQILEEKIKCL